MFDLTALTEHFPYLGLLILLIVGGIGLPFPEDTTLILAGFLVGQGVIRPVPAFFVLYIGLLGTDFFLYLMGRRYGRKVVEHKWFRKVISPERFSKLEEKFHKWGGLVVVIGRHVLGLRAQIFLAAGAMRMAPLKFIVADGASSIVTLFLMGGIGYAGGSSLEIVMRDLKKAEHVAVVGLVFLLAAGSVFWYFRKGKKK
jgi:membrane protein DedA with SNARE-associated domain